MKRLFLDESGDCSFSPSSHCDHFLLTILSIDSQEVNKIKNKLKRQFSYLIKQGWDKTEEIKATKLYNNKKFGSRAIINILSPLTKIKSLEVSYLVVNKSAITSKSFRDAPYGICYNFFSSVLLSKLMFEDKFYDVHLIFDERNKETHENKHFKEFLQTKILGTALENNIEIDFKLEGMDSSSCYGLLAVDFFSWSVFRFFEYNDDRFYNLIAGKLKRRSEWYIKKREVLP